MVLRLSINKRHYGSGKLKRKSNFAKLNTQELFKAVDKDNNDQIDVEEWMQFWVAVRQAGHTEEEIEEELTNLREGRAWVCFNDVTVE